MWESDWRERRVIDGIGRDGAMVDEQAILRRAEISRVSGADLLLKV